MPARTVMVTMLYIPVRMGTACPEMQTESPVPLVHGSETNLLAPQQNQNHCVSSGVSVFQSLVVKFQN